MFAFGVQVLAFYTIAESVYCRFENVEAPVAGDKRLWNAEPFPREDE